MKLSALAIRKKVFERSSEELLEVEQGDAIHRLLPHELLSLHHPVLRKDFYRRFLDQELIQYSLRGVEEKGKGPMIVCLDGSSSMSGDKEIWSKAVTLTLLEIARKQRRLFPPRFAFHPRNTAPGSRHESPRPLRSRDEKP